MLKEGLKYKIRNRITPINFESYTKLRATPIRAEGLVKEGIEQKAKIGPSEFVRDFSRKQGRRGGIYTTTG